MKHYPCDATIETCGEYFGKKDIYLLPNTTYTLIIDYPLSYPYRKKFTTGKNGMGGFALIQLIGKSYQHIYKVEDRQEKKDLEKPTKYGIWGHNIDDLVLEGILLDEKKKEIKLAVGS